MKGMDKGPCSILAGQLCLPKTQSLAASVGFARAGNARLSVFNPGYRLDR